MVGRMELAERLAAARDSTGLSQAGVAEQLGLPRSAVSKMENGEQRVDSLVLAEMARLYGVSVSALLEENAAEALRHSDVPAEALLRSAGNLSPEDRGALDEFLRMCQDYGELKRAMGEDDGR
jgi:transcriptional regulator with XRE-family HTH domain